MAKPTLARSPSEGNRRPILSASHALVICVGVIVTWHSAGCSSGNALGTVPVTGKVSYKGQAVAGATITFLGDGDSRTATAISASDGTYHLKTLDSAGAMPGAYTVLVEKLETPAELNRLVSMEEAAKNAAKPLPQSKKLLPAKYADATKTPLKFEVKKGQNNTIDLPLAD